MDNLDEMLSKVGENNKERHTLINIDNGSVIVSGVLSSGEQAECDQYLNAINNLGEGSTLGNDTILASSFSPSNTACLGQTNNVSLAIILGVTLPLLRTFLFYFSDPDHRFAGCSVPEKEEG